MPTRPSARPTGVILAGGRASRFSGAAKGLESIGGVRIVDRVAAELRRQCDDLLLVANDPRAPDWLPGVRTVPDVRANFGALGGIHAALFHVRAPVLVVAWDMPFVTAALLGELARAAGPGVTAVIPEAASGRIEPLCAWYSPALLPAIEARLEVGLRRANGLGDLDGARRLPLAEVRRFGDPARLFMNVNTAEDLARARTLTAAS
jgi:molybdopterin-guanine dinucleotide biosynthesis protein A